MTHFLEHSQNSEYSLNFQLRSRQVLLIKLKNKWSQGIDSFRASRLLG